MNTIVIQVLMGAKLDFMGSIGKRFNGKYRDFNHDWFIKIGSIFVTTMIANIFNPFIDLTIQILT